MCSDLSLVLSYLTGLQLQGKAYSTINIHRSMLSTTLGPCDGFDLGSHPLVVRLMKGCFNRSPPEPRYTGTWDPDRVLNYASASAPDEDLPLATLSAKLCTLLALATLLRVSEIASIAFKSILFSEAGVNVSLSRLRKAQRSGALQTLHIPSINVRGRCPVYCLKIYVTRTAALRNESNGDRLLIGINKPHKNVGGSTVGRWIKGYLSASGIDTTVFSAHSVRGAAASQAARRGVPIDTILGTANWSATSTFNRFYRRDIQVDTVAGAVFNN